MTGRDEAALLFEFDVQADRWSWSQGLRDLYALGPGEVPTTGLLLERMVEADRDTVRCRFAEHLRTPGPWSCTYRMHDRHGSLRRIRYVGQSEAGGGEVKRVRGFVIDITDLLRDHAAEAVAGAVEHRAVIEQAKGALMLAFGVDDVTAFELLRAYSNRANVKLVEVAERIAGGLSDAEFVKEDPVRSLLDIVLTIEGPRHHEGP